MNTSELNPGIRATVAWLRSHGFQTTDSGDGETHDYGCDQEQPYVHIIVHPADKLVSELNRLVELLRGRGIMLQPMDADISVPSAQGMIDPMSPFPATISLWNVVLSEEASS